MPTEALRIIDFMIVALAGGMVIFGVKIFTGVCSIVLVIPFIALEDVAPASYAIDRRAPVTIDEFGNKVICDAPGIVIDVFAGVRVVTEGVLPALYVTD